MITLSQVRNFKHRINPVEEVEGRGSFGYYIARPISLYLTWILLQTGMSPNAVTVTHLLIGMAGAVLLASEEIIMRLVGCGLLYFGFLIDNVDGEIARFRGMVSITGKYLDTVSHVIVNTLIFFFFGLGVFRDTGEIIYVLLAFLAALFSMRFDSFVMYTEAARSAHSNLDKDYDYYANHEGKLTTEDREDLQFASKKAGSSFQRLMYAFFAYPGTVHVVTMALVGAYIGKQHGQLGVLTMIPLAAVWIYGVLLPPRRMLTIWKVVKEKRTESEYVDLISNRPS